MQFTSIAGVFVLAVSGSMAAAVPPATPATSPTAMAKVYSSDNTQLSVLLADPDAKAVLVKHIPEVITRMGDNLEQAQGMTLKEIQGALKAYAPDVLNDQKLAAIDQDLAKLPPR